MNHRKVLGMLAATLALVGCGADCAQMCEDAKKCAGATSEQKAVDCEKTCEDAEKQAEGAGCEKQYEDALRCQDEHDVCGYGDACKTEIEALITCMTK